MFKLLSMEPHAATISHLGNYCSSTIGNDFLFGLSLFLSAALWHYGAFILLIYVAVIRECNKNSCLSIMSVMGWTGFVAYLSASYHCFALGGVPSFIVNPAEDNIVYCYIGFGDLSCTQPRIIILWYWHNLKLNIAFVLGKVVTFIFSQAFEKYFHWKQCFCLHCCCLFVSWTAELLLYGLHCCYTQPQLEKRTTNSGGQ